MLILEMMIVLKLDSADSDVDKSLDMVLKLWKQ